MGPTSAIELTNDLQVLSGQMPASRAAVRVSFVPNFPGRSRGLPFRRAEVTANTIFVRRVRAMS